ncbi:hypothetical protein CASFOL_028682 [Castilleja foliolosa]|uniref:FAD-binding domain-containing protein n=1 Tax=Castilleja foliolosa TaxID=1961234 RepID=A0ABD3CDE5_9LAMI
MSTNPSLGGLLVKGLQQILDSGKALPFADGVLINGQGRASFSGDQVNSGATNVLHYFQFVPSLAFVFNFVFKFFSLGNRREPNRHHHSNWLSFEVTLVRCEVAPMAATVNAKKRMHGSNLESADCFFRRCCLLHVHRLLIAGVFGICYYWIFCCFVFCSETQPCEPGDLEFLRQIKNHTYLSVAVDRRPIFIVLFVLAVADLFLDLRLQFGLHRLGIGSLVLESSDTLRTYGYAFALWSNAWKALDAIGIGHILREKHNRLSRLVSTSSVSGLPTAQLSLESDHEVRRINRKVLIETLSDELPKGTIRFSSKVVHIQDSGSFKLIHLADGNILKSKVLIGCDGVNSVVAKFLGFGRPSYAGRASIRGYVDFKGGHGFGPDFLQFFGYGVRYGVTPSDDSGVYWFYGVGKAALCGI